ncbi:hypothetical protein A8L45_10565 [Veronia pacifica]|uniref:diguanylate cyclase n=1 Tax=Veronia pacifica TaxID=1080227 RepID=A0A1C3EJA1_9GAMM|nr:hypothetical protein A8L45_10565 [Veronia pacifica]
MARHTLTPTVHDISLAVAGRNYSQLTMPARQKYFRGIKDLVFLDIRGMSDYSDLPVGVRYWREIRTMWRTDVTEDDLVTAREVRDGLSRSLVEAKDRKRVKLQYLFNKASEDLRVLESSLRLSQCNPLPWSEPDLPPQKYLLQPETETLHIKIALTNENGGSLWAVFDISGLYLLRNEIARDIVIEALLALSASLLIIWAVTVRVVAPIRRLASYMSHDLEKMDFSAMPELKRQDEIGALARMLKMLADKARVQLTELRRRSDTDVLTGLGGRRSYENDAQALFDRERYLGNGIGLVVCDIDNFKRYNDSFGHRRGDDVLRVVAQAITTVISDKDRAFRIGGEEFVVLSACQHSDELYRLAENLRKQVESKNLPHARDMGTVTMSVGAIFAHPDIELSYEQAFEQADALLYEAKIAGRNRLRLCQFSETNTPSNTVFDVPHCQPPCEQDKD